MTSNARRYLVREGIDVHVAPQDADTAAYVHDRRSGERAPLIETRPAPLGRHTLDELYSITLGEALETGVCVLTGAGGRRRELPPLHRVTRLAHEPAATGVVVLADLHGDAASAALEGGLDVLKLSDEELEQDGSSAPTQVSRRSPMPLKSCRTAAPKRSWCRGPKRGRLQSSATTCCVSSRRGSPRSTRVVRATR